MVGGNPSGVSLFVADDHAIRQGIQGILFAKHGKQLNRCLVSALCTGPRCGKVGTGKAAASGILDTGRLAHLHTDMGVISTALASGPAVPPTMVPRKCLINRAVIGINKPMDAGIIIRW